MKQQKFLQFTAVICVILGLTGVASAQSVDDRVTIAEANFASADANGDGVLDRDEFKAFINANAESDLGRAKQIRRFKAYGRAFSTLDADGNKSVTWAEVEAAQPGD